MLSSIIQHYVATLSMNLLQGIAGMSNGERRGAFIDNAGMEQLAIVADGFAAIGGQSCTVQLIGQVFCQICGRQIKFAIQSGYAEIASAQTTAFHQLND